MEKNGSPTAIFETDDERQSLLVTIPVHKSFTAILPGNIILTENENAVLWLCYNAAASKSEIAAKLKVSPTSGTIKRLLPKLIKTGLLEYTIPDKPNSSSQKYLCSGLAKNYLEQNF
jgi:ATP-dependent DNA helicase RecG